MDCRDAFPRIDALLDGELEAPEARTVEEHLGACPACRLEADDRGRLSLALARLELPSAPPLTPAFARPRRRLLPAAAALLLMSLVFLAAPSGIPDVVAMTSRLHDQVLSGALKPEDLGLRPSLPGSTFVGECCCPPELGTSAPFLVYRHGTESISLLVVEADPGPLPAASRRSVKGRDLNVFRSARNCVILCRSGRLTHLWVSRLPEEALIAAILATREGRRALSGERLSLEGVSCSACCEIVESKVRGVAGVKDAVVDLVSMELVVTPEGRAVDLERVMEAVRNAGYRASAR